MILSHKNTCLPLSTVMLLVALFVEIDCDTRDRRTTDVMDAVRIDPDVGYIACIAHPRSNVGWQIHARIRRRDTERHVLELARQLRCERVRVTRDRLSVDIRNLVVRDHEAILMIELDTGVADRVRCGTDRLRRDPHRKSTALN